VAAEVEVEAVAVKVRNREHLRFRNNLLPPSNPGHLNRLKI
jgi:hypothetical protein